MPTKQATEPVTNVETTVNKLEADLTYLENLYINEKTRSYNKEKREYKKDILQVYNIIHALCTDVMIQEIQKYSTYEAVSDAYDSVKLLKLIEIICYTHQVKAHKPLSLIKAEKTFITPHQAIDETNISYLDIFENIYTVYAKSGGEVAGPGMIAYDIERPVSSYAAGIDFDSLISPEQD